MKNIEESFEKLAARLAITEDIEKECRVCVKSLYDYHLNYGFGHYFKKYRLGGSFDRHTLIAGNFDVDCYFVFNEWVASNINLTYSFNPYMSPAKILLQELYKKLQLLNFQEIIEIVRDPPYYHAIPIKINQYIKVDCIPALQPNSASPVLIIPEGEKLKEVNPTLDEEALSEINTLNNGRITPLIRVIKYWNYREGKPIKSYVLERLVLNAFEEARFKNWVKAIRYFFQSSCKVIKDGEHVPDWVNPEKCILDELSDEKLDEIYEYFADASSVANQGDWKKLFGKKF